jgi:hypothetical protein
MVTLTAERGDRSGTRRTISRSMSAAIMAEASIAAGIASPSGHGVPGNQREASTVPARAAVGAECSTSEM